MLSTQQQRPVSLVNRIRHTEEVSVAFKVGGTDVLAAMDKVQAHDDTTQDSGSGGSGFSDLSALENETDEFGRRLLQHQRDAQRLNNALDGSRPQAFRRARPRPRLAERLEQNGLPNGDIDGRDHERTGSAGSNESEPPLNLPSQWGRRAKPRGEWLRRLHGPTEDEVPQTDVHSEETPIADEDAIMPHRTAYTGDEDWTEVADDPLESIENTPPSMRRRRPDSTPSSLRHMNSTLKDMLDSGEQDFSSASLLASTPAVNRRNRKIDELTRREIETVEKRGVTKRTLEQIIEQSSPKVAESRPVTAPSGDTSRIPRRRRSLIANKENVAPNGDSTRAHFKGSETVGLVNRTAQAVTFKNAERPAHQRGDSYNLLQRLARVSSMSPRPAKDKPELDVQEKRTSGEPVMDVGPLSAKSANSDYIAVEAPRKVDKEAEQQDLTREAESRPPAMDDPQQQPEPQAPDIDVTPAPEEPVSDPKTPVVTGAWLDTPATQTDVRPLLHATDSAIVRAFGSPSGMASLEPQSNPIDEPHRRVHSEPLQAKSALADVLREAKAASDTQFGDATIQSLEDIVEPDLDSTNPTLTIDIQEVAQEVIDAIQSGQPTTQAERDRRQEDLAMEAMNKHLRAARTSIKDANRGLRRVENRIETVQAVPESASASISSTLSSKVTTTKHERTVCPTCGGTTYHGSVWKALFFEILDCFFTYDPTLPTRIRPTSLGIFTLSFLTWYIIESTLCSYYCHQLYASSMIGYGVDPDAPEFPFVIPTLLFRPFKFAWEPALEYLAWWFEVVGNAAFGTDTASADPVVAKPVYGGGVREAFTSSLDGGWAAATAMTTQRIVQSAVVAVDEVGRFWDDELVG